MVSPHRTRNLSRRHCEHLLIVVQERQDFGNATARALGEELGMAMDWRRFRANFYVDWWWGARFTAAIDCASPCWSAIRAAK
jgi:hypothetical protein